MALVVEKDNNVALDDVARSWWMFCGALVLVVHHVTPVFTG